MYKRQYLNPLENYMSEPLYPECICVHLFSTLKDLSFLPVLLSHLSVALCVLRVLCVLRGFCVFLVCVSCPTYAPMRSVQPVRPVCVVHFMCYFCSMCMRNSSYVPKKDVCTCHCYINVLFALLGLLAILVFDPANVVPVSPCISLQSLYKEPICVYWILG